MPKALYIVVVCAPPNSFANSLKSPLQVRRTVIGGQSQRTRGLRRRRPQGTHILSTGCSFSSALQCRQQRTILYPHRATPTRCWVSTESRTQKERIAQALFTGFSRASGQSFYPNPGLAWVTATPQRQSLRVSRSDSGLIRQSTTICSRRGVVMPRCDLCARTALEVVPTCPLLRHPVPGPAAACGLSC